MTSARRYQNVFAAALACALVLAVFAPLQQSRAEGTPLVLEGAAVQGGLLVGEVPPGTRVALDGREVRVSAQGRFVIGFGRDAELSHRLHLAYPSGIEEVRPIELGKREYEIQRIDGLPEKMVTPPEEVLARIREENARIAAARAIDRPEPDFLSGWIWPAKGIVTGVYGSQRILNGEPRRPHFGIDIAAPEGTPVVAPADGVVTLAETGMYFTGGTLILDHGHGVSSAFLHLAGLLVDEGEAVSRGDPIARVGSTGRSTGAHLDWRINWFEERIDPALLAGPMPDQN
ncbi:MAG: M23 family metallopeptidase [Rhodovibrionaceae bacterium]|nr:M23 family metallopeptidase [Rhodovibrionaceae bacterium]